MSVDNIIKDLLKKHNFKKKKKNITKQNTKNKPTTKKKQKIVKKKQKQNLKDITFNHITNVEPIPIVVGDNETKTVAKKSKRNKDEDIKSAIKLSRKQKDDSINVIKDEPNNIEKAIKLSRKEKSDDGISVLTKVKEEPKDNDIQSAISVSKSTTVIRSRRNRTLPSSSNADKQTDKIVEIMNQPIISETAPKQLLKKTSEKPIMQPQKKTLVSEDNDDNEIQTKAPAKAPVKTIAKAQAKTATKVAVKIPEKPQAKVLTKKVQEDEPADEDDDYVSPNSDDEDDD